MDPDPKCGLDKLLSGGVDELAPGSRGCGRVRGSKVGLGFNQWSEQLGFCHCCHHFYLLFLTLLSRGLLVERRKPLAGTITVLCVSHRLGNPHFLCRLIGLDLFLRTDGEVDRGSATRSQPS